jgi:MFS family permease
VVLTFLLSLLLYIDRACISAATDSIRPALGFSEKQMGWVMSAFALGYALFQTPGGLLADRLGPRVVLAAVVSFWSLFTGLTAAAWSYVSMLVVRFLFGAGEAGAFRPWPGPSTPGFPCRSAAGSGNQLLRFPPGSGFCSARRRLDDRRIWLAGDLR